MKRVMLALLVSILAMSANAEVVINGVDPSDNWIGYMNVFDTSSNYQWGSSWGPADLKANFIGSELLLQANTNCYNAEDAYWVDSATGVGLKIMEANFYQEYYDSAGQTVKFNFDVLADTLTSAGYTAQAFIKVLDMDAGWTTTQAEFVDLTVGSGTVTLIESGAVNPVIQVGFMITGLLVDPASDTAGLAVVVDTIPEPATMAMLALGSLILRRKK